MFACISDSTYRENLLGVVALPVEPTGENNLLIITSYIIIYTILIFLNKTDEKRQFFKSEIIRSSNYLEFSKNIPELSDNIASFET